MPTAGDIFTSPEIPEIVVKVESVLDGWISVSITDDTGTDVDGFNPADWQDLSERLALTLQTPSPQR
jgi:hypothetical protein